MISLEAYRAVIDNFYFTIKALHSRLRNPRYALTLTGVPNWLRIMKLIWPNILVLFLSLILLQSGDIELNPGPPISTVRGSYHQADRRFGQSAGTQCMCNALFSVCFSVTRKACHWTTWDLDYILNMGDALYNRVGLIGQMLPADRLPDIVSFEGFNIQIHKAHLQDGLLRRTNESFLQISDHFNSNSGRSGMIFIIGGFTFSIIYTSAGVYVFDSHSRDDNGFPSPTGTSVLMKFRSLRETEEYIRQVYLENNNNEQQYFQIQYLYIVIPAETCLDIQRSLTRHRDGNRQKDVVRICQNPTKGK